MNIHRVKKASFSVIGKEGSTAEGEGIIGRLWESANAHFAEVQHLARKDKDGNFAGFWGVMSDFSRSFAPWENGFTQGLYLAGVECENDAQPPEGWTKWVIPGFEYLCVESTENSFADVLEYMSANGLSLAGAVHDYTCPVTGRNYMYFPVFRLLDAEGLWEEYKVHCGIDHNRYEAWQFGADADLLASLVSDGTKTATASAAILYKTENEPLPCAGQYSVILDSSDNAVCVIRTTRVYIVPFDEVTAEHAYKEGEGDRSLEYWRQCHRNFFAGEFSAAGLEFDEKMDVVCEEFETVYRPAGK